MVNMEEKLEGQLVSGEIGEAAGVPGKVKGENGPCPIEGCHGHTEPVEDWDEETWISDWCPDCMTVWGHHKKEQS